MTIYDVINSMSEEKQTAVFAMVASIMSSKEGGDVMSHSELNELTHSILEQGPKFGSLREAAEEVANETLQHADYGIEGIETLFPNEHETNAEPTFLNHNVEWVNKVLTGVSRQPFSRLRTTISDITGEELRAKGYTKCNLKTEEVLTLMRRSTSPTTIYKKQKIDRDDMLDITDFSVVSWIRKTMRLKLEEEIAACLLVGDGRDASSDDYIDRECIRPIHTDSELYSEKIQVSGDGNIYENFIIDTIKSRKLYKGSGEPTLYTTEDVLAELLLLSDLNGRFIYRSVDELARVMRVKEIVTVSRLENITRFVDDSTSYELMGIIVNLADYSIGADKGGQVAVLSDFDIDYNQEKYLIETRCSGALTVPKSALVFEKIPGSGVQPNKINGLAAVDGDKMSIVEVSGV